MADCFCAHVFPPPPVDWTCVCDCAEDKGVEAAGEGKGDADLRREKRDWSSFAWPPEGVAVG